jgi:hypothetical protein
MEWGFDSCGAKEVWVEVKDGAGQTDDAHADTSVNCSPTANAGPDKEVFETQTVTLEGSGSDTDGTISYSWSCAGGSLSDSTIAQPVYTAPSVTTDTNYTCTLTVTDNDEAADSDSVNVLVKNDDAPLAAISLSPAEVNVIGQTNDVLSNRRYWD